MPTPKCYSYIRFSSQEQRKGDSLRRQLELAANYAKEKNLELDTALSLHDLGISAFTGENRKSGALGTFLDLVESGEIPKNSILIVESLDRLSRENVFKALNQFGEIIRSGIKIVTLSDRMEYCQDTLENNMNQLFMSLIIMSRSYEESLQKSKRLKSAWENKRRNLNTHKLTSISPAWLTLNDKKTEFIQNSDRVKIVKEIFEMSLNGYGISKIAKTLNEKGVASWRKTNGWHSSYIHKILRNRSVIGEFQPYKLSNKERLPEGEPINDYFPRIVDEEAFYQVQTLLTNNSSYSGKTGTVRNLFGGIVKCGYCGSSMQLVNKGKKARGVSHLVCDSARRGLGCEYDSYTYEEVEKAIILFCREINLKNIFSDTKNDDSQKIQKLKIEIENKKQIIFDLNKKTENLVNLIADSDNNLAAKALSNKLEIILKEIDLIEKENLTSEDIYNELLINETSINNNISEISNLHERVAYDGTKENIDTRIKVRSILRKLIKDIKLYPVGKRESEEERLERIEKITNIIISNGDKRDVSIIREFVEKNFRFEKTKNLRYIKIFFNNHKILMLKPCPVSNDYGIAIEIDNGNISINDNIFYGVLTETKS